MSAPAFTPYFKSRPLAEHAEGVPVFGSLVPQVEQADLCTILPFKPGAPALEWMTQVYQLVARKEIDDALEILYDELLDPQTDGRFAECDELLALIDVDGLDTNLMIGVLAVTFQARDILRNRARVLHRIEKRLAQLAPDRIEALIGNLR